MTNSFLTYTNDVLAKLNEVQLTSTDFTDARGIQIQAKNAVNQAIRYINQREFCWPFNAEDGADARLLCSLLIIANLAKAKESRNACAAAGALHRGLAIGPYHSQIPHMRGMRN